MATVTGATPPTPPDGQEPDIPDKPGPEGFESPVAWLFGRQLIASLKWILLYAAFKGKLDHRDWMKPGIFPPDGSPSGGDRSCGWWNDDWDESKDFWFDYISDTGDGQMAMYSVAYMCMSDLAIKDESINGPAEFVPGPDKLEAGKTLLPRGAFLFVGGDTSYHISDYATLGRRFQNPFWWAYRDLSGQAKSAAVKVPAQSVMMNVPRPLVGIPGNHDYYDSLDGFNRQFRRPCTEDRKTAGVRNPQLMIPTFCRVQEASYLAMRLPFGWWFWGLDTEAGEIDFRQLEFFKGLQEEFAPKKLIVATPEPTTVFGKFAKSDENQSKTFAALELKRPFLKNPEPLGEGKCRVDLAGDVHHYSRYFSHEPGPGKTSNYASVMSGGGGAFFHPSHTSVGEVKPQALYPPADDSRKEVANQLFNFKNIWTGGWVWLFGFVIAFVLSFAANFPQSSRDAINSFPPFVGLEISPREPEQMQEPQPYVKPMPRYRWGPGAEPTPRYYYLWMSALVLALVLLGAAVIYASRVYQNVYDPSRLKRRKKVSGKQSAIIWGLVLLSFAALAFGLLGFQSNEMELTRFGRSLIVLAALLWSVLAIIQSQLYSGWLFEECHYRNLEWWSYWPVWALLFMALLGFGSSVWFFGKQESAFLISDLVFLLVLLIVGLGLVYFAFSTGGHLKKGVGKLGFLLLGVSHALLQLAVPFLLVRKGHLMWAPLAAIAVIFVFNYVGRGLAKQKSGWPLAVAWVVFGSALLSIPFILHAAPLNMPDDGWQKLALCLYAGALGAIISCVLFGWYLAVALGFNGHNNEAGGAARIEGFKQLIRFRLNRDGLTGYVIALDRSGTKESELHPKLVDVFRVSERPSNQRPTSAAR